MRENGSGGNQKGEKEKMRGRNGYKKKEKGREKKKALSRAI